LQNWPKNLSLVNSGQSLSLGAPHLSKMKVSYWASSFPGIRGFDVRSSEKKHLSCNEKTFLPNRPNVNSWAIVCHSE